MSDCAVSHATLFKWKPNIMQCNTRALFGHVTTWLLLPTPVGNNNGGCVVECRICNWEVAGSNLGLDYFAPRSTQPSIPPRSVNECQLRLGRQRQVWLIPIADERVGVQVKLWNPLRTRCHTWALLRWWITTKRRYIKRMHLTFNFYITRPPLQWLQNVK